MWALRPCRTPMPPSMTSCSCSFPPTPTLLCPQGTFLGALTGEALATAYASADVFLYPSTTEGCEWPPHPPPPHRPDCHARHAASPSQYSMSSSTHSPPKGAASSSTDCPQPPTCTQLRITHPSAVPFRVAALASIYWSLTPTPPPPISLFRWGGTCIEAQASGLPIVATNSSGITDVVAHGRTGFLAPPGMYMARPLRKHKIEACIAWRGNKKWPAPGHHWVGLLGQPAFTKPKTHFTSTVRGHITNTEIRFFHLALRPPNPTP
jgi:hypothetical protein